jgi:Tat protein secretion system quality control protein TatD with DNase activity
VRLASDPNALLGEVGLDHIAKSKRTGDVEKENQLRVLRLQLALGAAFARPASLHCVRAGGALLELCRAGSKAASGKTLKWVPGP